MRFFFIFLLFCISQTVYGQNTEVSFTLVTPDSPCDIVEKEITVTSKTRDSIYFSDRSDRCTFTIQLPVNSTFDLFIRAQNYHYKQVTIETKNNPNLLLDSIVLEPISRDLEEVTITGIKKKFIQIDAEKTIVTVTDNPVLEIASVYDAILKIPGVVPYPGGGFALGGQLANVQFDGIPSNLGTNDLMNLLKSMPANSITSIELITNPGASYDATISGSIINLVSQGLVTKWFSATLSLNYGWNENNKISPSLLVSGKGNKFTYQLQTGISYNERTNWAETDREYTTFTNPTKLFSKRRDQSTSRYAYFTPSLTYRFKNKSMLTASYRLSGSLNSGSGSSFSSSVGLDTAVSLSSSYRTSSPSLFNAISLRYKIFFDTLERSMTINAYTGAGNGESIRETDQTTDAMTNFSLIKNNNQNLYTVLRSDFEIPFKKIKFGINTGVKLTLNQEQNTGRYNLQSPSEEIYQNPTFPYSIDFKYSENNAAGYLELKKGLGKKINITAGLRAENYTLSFRNLNDSLIKRTYFNLFPSVHFLYRISPAVRFKASYSRKISMPNASQFDPNLSGYYDSYSSSSGNAQLQPNYYNQGEAEFTIFDYCELSVNVSHASSIVLNEVNVAPNSLVTNSSFRTYSNVSTISYYMSLPVPFGLFTKGMAFFEENVDVDNISFLYLYANCNQTNIPGYTPIERNKPLWTFGVYSQFMLPGKIRMNASYSYTNKGTYQLYTMARVNSGLEVVFSREFQERKWKASISFQDIFNQTQNTVLVAYQHLNIRSYSKNDTRIVWFKLSYTFGRVDKNQSDVNLPSKPEMGTEL